MNPPTTRSARSESGFALPITIFLVAIITVMLASSFARAASEHRISDSSAAEQTVLAVAQSGLQAIFDDSLGARPTATDSFRYNVTGGYAWVSPEPFHIPDDTMAGDFMYIVRSTGYYIVPSMGTTPQAVRSVAQFAVWQPGFVRPTGAYTSLSGIDSTGSSGNIIIDGNDQCGVLDTNGLRVPQPSVTGASYPTPGPPTGNLAWVVAPSAADVADSTGIDWFAIENGGLIVPDYTSLVNLNTYATYFITSDFDPADVVGTGLLIVTGDFIPRYNFQWNGLVLVGERFNTALITGTSQVRGMVVDGLRITIGFGVGRHSVNNNLDIRFDSCEIRKALNKYRGFRPVANTWVDNWASY